MHVLDILASEHLAVSTHERVDRLVIRDPQLLCFNQRFWVARVAAEVMKKMFDFAGNRHRFAKVSQRLAGFVEFPLPFF